jgi:hypothetical protein
MAADNSRSDAGTALQNTVDPRADLVLSVERSLSKSVHEFLGFHNADEAFFEYGAVPSMNHQRLIDAVFGAVEQTDWKVATVQTDRKTIILHRE